MNVENISFEKLNPGEKLPKSKYKGVYAHLSDGKYINWVAIKKYKGKQYRKTQSTERAAALSYDKMCLSFGLEPVNILVRK
ncbi:hypothetical protein QO206_13245 [Leeuwenhoekiella aequorea]|uniref:hypothetical protein n=1 Tax=Leeuwenhoekiella aequorea TaxID=283736 RepID=UPI00352C20CD|tara:strand:+ start:13257 stop:13499 length:243 start_codon:yes stop_codon:yes gene_type:complete